MLEAVATRRAGVSHVANNYAAADRVMIALGLEHQVRDLVPKYEAAVKEVEGLKLEASDLRTREDRGPSGINDQSARSTYSQILSTKR